MVCCKMLCGLSDYCVSFKLITPFILYVNSKINIFNVPSSFTPRVNLMIETLGGSNFLDFG